MGKKTLMGEKRELEWVEVSHSKECGCSCYSDQEEHHDIHNIVVVHIGLDKQAHDRKQKEKKILCRAYRDAPMYRYEGFE